MSANSLGKPLLVFLVVLLMLACAPGGGDRKGKMPVYRIGYMICNSEQETLSRFRPLTAYLGKKLGVKFEAVAIDTVDFTRAVEGLDFTHTNSLLYIIMSRNHGVDILAAEKAGSLGSRSRGVVAALKTSGFRSLKDLRGRRMVFGPMLAPTGYLSQLDLLMRAGLDPEADLFYTIPSGSFKHEKIIYGVLFGKYDAGAFPMSDFELMAEEGKIDPEDFVILAEGPPIPYCNFGATQRTDDAFAAQFKKTLLAITKNDTVELDGETVRVLERAGIDGYEDIRDRDFDAVREMAKRTNMPPYQRF